MDSTSSGLCSAPSDWGPCQQPTDGGQCSAHRHWELKGITPDPYYLKKLILGQVQATFDYITDEEAEILLNGRQRGDGRRLDSWVAGDAVGWTGS